MANITRQLWIISIFIAACVGIFFLLPQTILIGSLNISLMPVKLAFILGFISFIISLIFLAGSTFSGATKKTKKFCEIYFDKFYKLAFALIIGILILASLFLLSERLALKILSLKPSTLSLIILMIFSFLVGLLVTFIQEKFRGKRK